jgi:ABC-type uncharacterized transport system ATPase subunit
MRIIETVNVTKKYGDFTANDTINLSVEQGEIKAIVGENGAGKSTLMNLLYGLSRPTSGKILVRGQEVDFSTPLDAINAGLGMVHQHFKLVPSLTVFENVLLGIEFTSKIGFGKIKMKTPVISNKKECEKVQQVIDKFKFDLHASDKVEDLSVGEKQRVEILKMLYRNVDILILDEPTAVLTPQEVVELMASLKELKTQGKTIIIITHKLGEVMELSDSVTIVRRGKVVGNVLTKDTSQRELAQLMVGRDVVLRVNKEEIDTSENEIVYQLENITTNNIYGKEVLSNINLQVRSGEILGIAGVEGNGQSELVKVLTGMMTTTKGKISLNGKDMTNKWPADIRKAGIGIIHEDRYQQGLCRDMTINENTVAGYQCNSDVCKNGFMRYGEISKKRDRLVEEYDVRLADPAGNVSQLSGGNAQKLIIAREFDQNPKLLIACQPTRGVDVGSIEFIHNKILDLRKQGTGVILVSSELTEIMSLSDRIAVMSKGKIIGELNGKETTSTQIGLLMAGIAEKEEN